MISEDTLSIGKKGRGSLAAVEHPKLGEDMRDVVFNSFLANVNMGCNLSIA